MQAITSRYGHSPLAFLLVPVTGAFLIDITNALLLQGFLDAPVVRLLKDDHADRHCPAPSPCTSFRPALLALLAACEGGPGEAEVEKVVQDRISQAFPEGAVKLDGLRRIGSSPATGGDAEPAAASAASSTTTRRSRWIATSTSRPGRD